MNRIQTFSIDTTKSFIVKEKGFAVEIEITCLSFNCSRRFTEAYIPYSYRNHGVSKLENFDGFKSLAKLFTIFLRTDVSDKQKPLKINAINVPTIVPPLSTGFNKLRKKS